MTAYRGIGDNAKGICVSASQNLRKLMKDNQISPSKALKIGVDTILKEEFVPEVGFTYQETETSRRKRIQSSMQRTIDELNIELEQMKIKNVAVQKR